MGLLVRALLEITKPRVSELIHIPQIRNKNCRLYDFERGEYKKRKYTIEGLIQESSNGLDIISRFGNNLFGKIKTDGALAEYGIDKIFDSLSKRPSYNKNHVDYTLIINGIKFPFSDNDPSHSLHYQILEDLSMQKYRTQAEKMAKKNCSDPKYSTMGFRSLKTTDGCIKFLTDNSKLAHDYFVVYHKNHIPVLHVNDMTHGHEAARDCINFYLNNPLNGADSLFI